MIQGETHLIGNIIKTFLNGVFYTLANANNEIYQRQNQWSQNCPLRNTTDN